MAIEHLLGTLLPLKSVQLGRLVVNAGKPHEEFIDPLHGRPVETELIQNLQTAFTETRRFSKNSKLRTYLSDILSVSFERQSGGNATLSAPQAKTYDLPNSTAWFEAACAEPKTQRFLEAVIDNSKNVYLVVGFRTVYDARLVQGITLEKAQSASVAVQALGASPAANTGAPGVKFGQASGNGQQVSFKAPGEQIFAVLYRKVKFKWLSSRTISNMSLEAKNRWVSCWNGWRGPGGEQGEEEEDDVIEAYLTDSDLETSDGEYDSEGEEEPSSHVVAGEGAEQAKEIVAIASLPSGLSIWYGIVLFLGLFWGLSMLVGSYSW